MANVITEEREPTDEELDDIIDKEYPEIELYGDSFTPSEILKTMNPDLYEIIRIENLIEDTKYFCEQCDTEYDDEFSALCCCSENY